MDKAFDELTALAAIVCGTTSSVLAMVEPLGNSFRSAVGIGIGAAAPDGPLCASAIYVGELLLLPDAAADSRFNSDEFVTGDAGARFFAGAPLINAEGESVGALCVFDRVPRHLSTDQQRSLQALAKQGVTLLELARVTAALGQSERRFRSIIEEANEAYISFEPDGVIHEWNREAERLLGWTRDEIIGSSVVETVVPADLWERVGAALAEAPTNGDSAPTRVDATALTKSGHELPVEFTFLPLTVDGEHRINVLLHDISARRRVAVNRERLLKTEQEAGVELTSQNEKLRELDAMKDQFISVVSHELRTPLAAIRGYLEIVLGEEPGPLTDEQKRFLGIIDFSSEQLVRVADDLLLIGKLQSGHLDLEIAQIDLPSMLESCVVAAGPAADAKQVGLRLPDGHVPSVTGDLGRLTQALGNIISNAIKFTKDGRVDVRLYAERDRAIIEIVDTGVGVPAAEVKHLFVPFFRASTATRHAIPGTGLGLSIAKEIVEAHGGTITVESEEGFGTSFRVELPVSSER